jgi:hypothetical protein
MKILAIIAALHVSAGNHTAGIEWCTCAEHSPVTVRLPEWHATATLPPIRVRDAWSPRAGAPIPLARHR